MFQNLQKNLGLIRKLIKKLAIFILLQLVISTWLSGKEVLGNELVVGTVFSGKEIVVSTWLSGKEISCKYMVVR